LVSRIVASHKPMLGSVMSEEGLLAILREQDAKRDHDAPAQGQIAFNN